jgi:hypothetical protein
LADLRQVSLLSKEDLHPAQSCLLAGEADYRLLMGLPEGKFPGSKEGRIEGNLRIRRTWFS